MNVIHFATKTAQFMNCIVAIKWVFLRPVNDKMRSIALKFEKNNRRNRLNLVKYSVWKAFFAFFHSSFICFFLFRLNTCYLVAKCTCADWKVAWFHFDFKTLFPYSFIPLKDKRKQKNQFHSAGWSAVKMDKTQKKEQKSRNNDHIFCCR